MGKKVQQSKQVEKSSKTVKHSKLNRFNQIQNDEPVDKNRKTWPSDAVVYIGHLPHGFYQNQLKEYFSQYGDVLGVKVARSRKTTRSRGYAFIQFKYSEVADIVSQTMNNYLLMGKVLSSNTLKPSDKNPFHFPSSKKYKFVNWKKLYIKKKNQKKDEQAVLKQMRSLLEKEKARRQKFKELNINYQYPGYSKSIQ